MSSCDERCASDATKAPDFVGAHISCASETVRTSGIAVLLSAAFLTEALLRG